MQYFTKMVKYMQKLINRTLENLYMRKNMQVFFRYAIFGKTMQNAYNLLTNYNIV